MGFPVQDGTNEKRGVSIDFNFWIPDLKPVVNNNFCVRFRDIFYIVAYLGMSKLPLATSSLLLVEAT